jgi:hypothetical protein
MEKSLIRFEVKEGITRQISGDRGYRGEGGRG